MPGGYRVIGFEGTLSAVIRTAACLAGLRA
jgi:hypothetical protein